MSVQFDIRGTTNQQQIIRAALAKIYFPWDKITRYSTIVVYWDDLNDGTLAPGPGVKRNAPSEHEHGSHSLDPSDAPPHIHVDDPELGEGHAISRKEEGRWRIAGVFWTSGRIGIDLYYESHPSTAQAIFSAEAAHLADYGIPYTSEHKRRINNLLHTGNPDADESAHGHPEWWEVNSYSTEYYVLPGEANMDLWTFAYSDMDPGQWPNHPSNEVMGDELRKILNIQRTDATAGPVGPVQPTPAIRLTARAWVTSYGNGRAELKWTGAQGTNVTVWRNGARLMTTANDGIFVNNLASSRGAFKYQVKDGGGRASNVVAVSI